MHIPGSTDIAEQGIKLAKMTLNRMADQGVHLRVRCALDANSVAPGICPAEEVIPTTIPAISPASTAAMRIEATYANGTGFNAGGARGEGVSPRRVPNPRPRWAPHAVFPVAHNTLEEIAEAIREPSPEPSSHIPASSIRDAFCPIGRARTIARPARSSPDARRRSPERSLATSMRTCVTTSARSPTQKPSSSRVANARRWRRNSPI